MLEAKAGGSYELDFSGNRDMCLDANAAATAPGTRIQQWRCNGGGNQHWVFEPAGDGRYKIADSQDRSKVLAAGSAVDAKGNPYVQLATDTGAADQLWQLTKLGIVYVKG
ncbi:RICIN domain-containing protein [Kitasatospora sp. NPDC048545]|uniref:RICIN domain-containing protein n=1 Tax=Kitasatospora sp. NPDC048545 TaxID=3157208 RepID=UPI0033E09D90